VKQIGILRGRKRARQRLVKVMVRIDETWEDDHPACIYHAVSRRGQFARRAHLLDDIVANEERAIADFAARRVHRYKCVGVFEKKSWHCVIDYITLAKPKQKGESPH